MLHPWRNRFWRPSLAEQLLPAGQAQGRLHARVQAVLVGNHWNSTGETGGGQSSPPPSPRGGGGGGGAQNLWLFPNNVAQAKSNWTEVLTASNLLRFLCRFRVSEPCGHVSKPVGPAGRRLRIPPWTRDRGCRALNKRGPGHGGTCRGQGTLGTPGCLLPLVCTSVFVSPAGSPVPPRPPDVQACVQACERVCACSGVSTRVCV